MPDAAIQRLPISNLSYGWIRLFRTAVAALLFAACFTAAGAAQAQQRASVPAPADSAAARQEAPRRVMSYTLPPDLDRKARHLGQIAFWGQIAGFLYSVAILLLVLRTRLAPRFRDWAERAGGSRILQAAIFAPLLLLTVDVLGIPFDAAEHAVSRRFGLSVQGWGSWLGDWTKGELLTSLLAIVLVWILYGAIRRSPRRWWLWFWAALLPIAALLVFLQPLVVDPMFHKFEPLAEKNPPLANAIEALVQRSGEDIPRERIYWMGASEKTTELNAYVTGIGSSKRIVVWDTTIARLDTPETVAVVGHEMGHYVLRHIVKGLAAGAALLFLLLYLGHGALGWLLARQGARWGIREAGDWASLPVLLLLLAIFSFASDPITNLFSRYIEHQADQYGLEVTHELLPDSGEVAAQSFQVLGEVDLEDPAPNPLDVFLFYTHPPIASRIRFALAYDPWAHGGRGKFVP